ncbi:MAG: GDP-mannose 4,6-dehydratase [Anaerolineae bacterium]
MRALITGISGFAGSFLTEYLLAQASTEVWGVSIGPTDNIDPMRDRITYLTEDLADPTVAARVLEQCRPDLVFHLAAQAFVPVSWQDPWSTMENNIRAQVNLLHVLAQQRSAARILIIGSNEEYGRVQPDELPITEQTPLRPDSPYGVSKIAQDFLALQYYISHHLYTVRARPFNHIGPRQNDRFVASDFAKQVAEIEAGLREPVMRVGNLESKRDFTDVRDMVRAYALALDKGQAGEVYNIGSGQAHSIRELLDYYRSLTTVSIRVEQDAARSRPSDTPVTVCDATKFRQQTGWAPRIPFEQTLRDTLDYWRARVKAQINRK